MKIWKKNAYLFFLTYLANLINEVYLNFDSLINRL